MAEAWVILGQHHPSGVEVHFCVRSHTFGVTVDTLFSAWFILALESNALQLPIVIHEMLSLFVKNLKAHVYDAEPAITPA